MNRAELHAARQLAEQLLDLAEKRGNPDWLLEAHRAVGITFYAEGRLVPARRHLEQPVGIYDPRQHHAHRFQYLWDPGSVPPLGGPNEEINPLDIALGALATCGTFIYVTTAQEMGIPLDSIATTVEADFDLRGVGGAPVNPRIQAMRVHMELEGPDEAQAEQLAEALRNRCPIYTTLVRAAPIEIENVTE